MSLKLDTPYEKTGLHMEKVSNKSDALLWEKLFMQVFNYRISTEILLSSYEKIEYLIAYHENEPIGTGILYNDGNKIIGVHSMGIIPTMRRKGLAEQMMINMLDQSVGKGFEYATLQASDNGKGLYLKLGFEEQFTLKNYVLNGQINSLQ